MFKSKSKWFWSYGLWFHRHLDMGGVCMWEISKNTMGCMINLHYKMVNIFPSTHNIHTVAPQEVRYGYRSLYSISGRMSHSKILWRIEAARLGAIIIISLWNLTGISAALLSRCFLNFRAIGKVQAQKSWLQDFTRSRVRCLSAFSSKSDLYSPNLTAALLWCMQYHVNSSHPG